MDFFKSDGVFIDESGVCLAVVGGDCLCQSDVFAMNILLLGGMPKITMIFHLGNEE